MNVAREITRASCIAALIVLVAGCGADEATPRPPFTLSSPDVGVDGVVPDWAIGRFSGYCEGENRSIGLSWTDPPADTRSLAVVMVDGSYSHWVVTGIPATATALAPADNGQISTGVVGESLSGPSSYIGPCVAGHEYVYTIYALDTMLNGNESMSLEDAKTAMDGHVLAESSLATKRP